MRLAKQELAVTTMESEKLDTPKETTDTRKRIAVSVNRSNKLELLKNEFAFLK
jgi:hypothetical protein